MTYQSQGIIRRSVINGLTPAPRTWDFQEEMVEPIDVTTCIGYKTCQVTCSERNDVRDTVGNSTGVYDNPNDLSVRSWTVMRSSEAEQNGKLGWLICKDGCMYYSDPGYLEACPAEGAIIRYANGIVNFQSEQCIGCSYYTAGCPLDIPRFNPEDNCIYKCMLCVDRMVVGQESACVKTCPTDTIHFGTKEPIKTLASERVAELKTCGYSNAGLCSPVGVGGTHVMYVLHHASKPNLYHGLPGNPKISEVVKFRKGIWKPLAAVGFAVTSAASIFHYVSVDSNRVDEEGNNLHEEKDEEHE